MFLFEGFGASYQMKKMILAYQRGKERRCSFAEDLGRRRSGCRVFCFFFHKRKRFVLQCFVPPKGLSLNLGQKEGRNIGLGRL